MIFPVTRRATKDSTGRKLIAVLAPPVSAGNSTFRATMDNRFDQNIFLNSCLLGERSHNLTKWFRRGVELSMYRNSDIFGRSTPSSDRRLRVRRKKIHGKWENVKRKKKNQLRSKLT